MLRDTRLSNISRTLNARSGRTSDSRQELSLNDDPNLVSRAGLVPVMALAQRAGLADLVAGHVRPGGPCGVNPQLKIPCLVAGMAAGGQHR